jgi:hypothetical protein
MATFSVRAGQGGGRCHGFSFDQVKRSQVGQVVGGDEWMPSGEAGKALLIRRVLRAKAEGSGEGFGTDALITIGAKFHFETKRAVQAGAVALPSSSVFVGS